MGKKSVGNPATSRKSLDSEKETSCRVSFSESATRCRDTSDGDERMASREDESLLKGTKLMVDDSDEQGMRPR